jgi:hypothetical protein
MVDRSAFLYDLIENLLRVRDLSLKLQCLMSLTIQDSRHEALEMAE